MDCTFGKESGSNLWAVYDMYGKQMLTGSLSSRQQHVDTAQLPSGTYLLTLTGNLQTWSDKVVVQ
ncbi:MAG: T9SS type A sorting domain-containing protein [Candidatus Cloacimonetes bacterium]|nr:T9SS type A sorting domain-containing protein [Candidatus Cloacimonadota bacterium]